MTKLNNQTKLARIDEPSSDEEIQVPQKKIIKDSEMVCKIHSTPYKKQSIKYINLSFIKKNKPTNYQTFLCDLCYEDLKRKNTSTDDLGRIRTLKKFQQKYIESVFKKYTDDRPLQQTINLLEKTELYFCNQIDSLNESFNQYCQIYKRNIKQIFPILKKPFDGAKVQAFTEGKINQGMVEEFYRNYVKINKYSTLIGPKNKEVVETWSKGFQATIEVLKEDFKKQMNLSFGVLKQYIQKYNQRNPQIQSQSSRMVPQVLEKKEALQINSQKKKKNQNSAPIKTNNDNLEIKKSSKIQQNQVINKKKVQESKKSKQIRQRLPQSSQSQSDSEDQSSNQSQKRMKGYKINGNKREQKGGKRHMIQKEKKERPFRTQNIHMIDEEFIKNSNNRCAVFIVVKAHSEKSGSESVHRMEIEDFKRRYPQAFNRYLHKRTGTK